jgi:hypothetical protein
MRVAAREPRVGNLLGVGIAGGATGKRKDAGNERRREARAADLEPVGLPLVPRRVVDCGPRIGVCVGGDIGDTPLSSTTGLTPVAHGCLPGVSGLVCTAASTGATPGALTAVGVAAREVEGGTAHSHDVR